MKSVREVFKIGRGPSNSHTMGPEKAARIYKEEHPDAQAFRVRLYGSLCRTGKGHGTDRVLYETLAPVPAEVIFCKETPEDVTHPNTMDFFVMQGDQETEPMRALSIGGGDIRIVGRDSEESEDVYPENSFAEVMEFCQFRSLDLAEYVELTEGPQIRDYLRTVWKQMKKTTKDGLKAEGMLPGPLKVERKAKKLFDFQPEHDHPQIRECRLISAYAFAVSEQNADCGTVVTAPTCGSCGVIPAVFQ